MFPYIRLYFRTIPTYTITAILGILAVLLYFWILKKRKQAIADEEDILVWGLAGGLVGAKVLYLLLCLPDLLSELPFLFSKTSVFLEKYVFSGFVFYGGLYGCLLAVMLYCRRCSRKPDSICQAIPAIPLFHCFGRIGCFCMGCCYGIPWAHGIAFEHSQIAPNGIPLVPVQLFESIGELLLFLILRKCTVASVFLHGVSAYLLMYGVLRFLLEFLRGDSYRGFVGILSVSQWLSLFGIIVGAIILLGQKRRGEVDE